MNEVTGTTVTPPRPSRAAEPKSPARTLEAEVRYRESGKFAAFYALMGPHFKERCSFAKLMNVAPTQRRQLGNASVHVLRVRVVGSKAYLDYAFVRAGTVLATIKGDVYVRVRGTWLDALDGYTNC